MPTKERRARERLAAEHEAELDSLLGEVPEFFRSKPMGPVTNHFVNITIPPPNLYPIDEDGTQYMSEEVSDGSERGNQAKREEKEEHKRLLKEAFAEFWFKRGASKRIASESAGILGLKENLSQRTIQDYIKEDKKLAKSASR
jgi:hypothetical protein